MLNPRQLILSLKEQLGELKAVPEVGKLAKISEQHRTKPRVFPVHSPVKDCHVEA